MPELAMKKFTVLRPDRPPFHVEARNVRDFSEKARCTSRTEMVRALRKGKSFFIEKNERQDYHSRGEDFCRINVALEAFRNMGESGESCCLHVITHDNAQISFSLLPKKFDGDNGSSTNESNEVRRKFAKYLHSLVSQGTVLLITGANADS